MTYVIRVRHKGFCEPGHYAMGYQCCERVFTQTEGDIDLSAKTEQRDGTIAFFHTERGRSKAVEFNTRDLCVMDAEMAEE